MKTFPAIFLTAVLAATATWLVVKSGPSTHSEARKPLFYQSAMHPWIKSDKPGRCTICGMELTPVYSDSEDLSKDSGKNQVMLGKQQTKILGVATQAVKKQPLVRHLSVTGMVDDDETRHRILSAYVAGRIEKLGVNYTGATVTEGQPLAEIYSPALLQAEREYRQLNGELKRMTALRLRQMGLTAEQIQALPNKPADALTTAILAPMSGTVVARDVYEGQYVTEGEKLFEIADFSTMWFKFDAYEQDLPWLAAGQKVNVTTTSQPGKTFEGRIAFIDPNFNESTRSTKVRVELPNPDLLLKHRVTADGKIEIITPETLTIPKSAVIQTGTDAHVYVDQQGSAYEQRLITTGRRGDDDLEVLSGLHEGENVVTTGTVLIDGQAELQRPQQAETPKPQEHNPDKKAAMNALLATADALSKSLAADDLSGFNSASGNVAQATAAFIAAFGDSPQLREASDFKKPTDLKQAREAFFAWSMAATSELQKFDVLPAGFQIWECPMVDEAIPIPGKKGRWIQSSTRPGQNPYFGSAMPNCGELVKGGHNHD
ncbi:MAG: efflux RND transporter periplasmic adaptor subunit [Luteolibacter sp.]